MHLPIMNSIEQIMGILKYLTEWLVNHILYVDGQIPKGWYGKKGCYFLESSSLFYFEYKIWHIPKENWEILSQKTKKELFDENKVIGKIDHTAKWKQNVSDKFRMLEWRW